MSLILRKIRKKNTWEFNETARKQGLSDGEPSVRALRDLADGSPDQDGTEAYSDRISIFRIGADRSDFARVIAAIACARKRLEEIDYLIVEEGVIFSCSTPEECPGETPDAHVNSLHLDCLLTSAVKLVELARQCMKKADSCPKLDVFRAVRKSIQNGWIADGDLPTEMRASYDELIARKIPDR